jgi:hypothetical protein
MKLMFRFKRNLFGTPVSSLLLLVNNICRPEIRKGLCDIKIYFVHAHFLYLCHLTNYKFSNAKGQTFTGMAEDAEG